MAINESLLTFFKKVFPPIIYIVLLLLVIEVSSRSFWSINYNVSFRHPNIIHAFYPELRKVEQEQINNEDGYFDILLLGGSVLDNQFGCIEKIMLEKLTYRSRQKVRIHNLAKLAHTSLDSYYKYRYLADKKFDLVLFYHGINEARANNSPPSVFKNDYSHYSWYKSINEIKRHKKIQLITFPYTFNYFLIRLKEVSGFIDFVPTHSIPKEWVKYGGDIKTKEPFKENLTKILDIAKKKNECVLLMTFAFYVPEDYTVEKFLNKSLDYSMHFSPIEIWGDPENVISAISAHNAIIEDVAQLYRNVKFVNQNNLIPKNGQYFNDICHFTHEGSERFVDNILDIILGLIQSTSLNKENERCQLSINFVETN